MRMTMSLLSMLVAALAACSPTPTQPPAATAADAAVTRPPPATAPAGDPTAAAPTAAPAATEPAPTPEGSTAGPVAEATAGPATSGAPSGLFVKEEVDVTGSYAIDPAENVLRLSDDFQVRPGPDLFVVLSGAGDLSADYITFSKSVVESPFLNLGPLGSASGAQQYPIPAGTDLSLYQTVVIWCRAYSVAFAAAPLHR